MAANAYLTYRNGKIEVPPELQVELGLKEGDRFTARLEGDLIIQTRIIPDKSTT